MNPFVWMEGRYLLTFDPLHELYWQQFTTWCPSHSDVKDSSFVYLIYDGLLLDLRVRTLLQILKTDLHVRPYSKSFPKGSFRPTRIDSTPLSIVLSSSDVINRQRFVSRLVFSRFLFFFFETFRRILKWTRKRRRIQVYMKCSSPFFFLYSLDIRLLSYLYKLDTNRSYLSGKLVTL